MALASAARLTSRSVASVASGVGAAAAVRTSRTFSLDGSGSLPARESAAVPSPTRASSCEGLRNRPDGFSQGHVLGEEEQGLVESPI